MSDENKPTWKQLEGESAQAYAAFIAYCELGAERSIDAAWTGAKQGQNRGKRAPSHWQKWSSKYRWVDRARSWDAEHVESAIESSKGEYLQYIEQYKNERFDGANDLYEVGRGLLKEVKRRLDVIERVEKKLQQTSPDENLSGEDLKAIASAYDLKSLAAATSAAEKAISAGLHSKAHGLAMERLMKKFEIGNPDADVSTDKD